jgi:hypothetical protein
LGEVGIDWIDLLDERKRGRSLGRDQRAFRDEGAADDARNRRADLGVVQVNPGLLKGSLGELDIGISLGKVGHGLVVGDAAGDVPLSQCLLALELLACIGLHRLGLLQRRLGAVGANPEEAGLDAKKHVALLDEAALLEDPLLEDA